ncbi:MAG: hypothetical protein M3R14_01925 [Acidobacteriota bacterium]|nr:hypothetical protein [Acidobacteriota bacterium]
MFGIGKILGSVAGGLLDKIGLGKIAPFVKLGLNALTGNWLGVAQDVFGLVSNFKGNFMGKAATKPPLGGFEQAFQGKPSINENRISGLFKGLSGLFNAFKSFSGGGDLMGSIGKIFSAFNVLKDSFSNNQMYNSRSLISQFSDMRP